MRASCLKALSQSVTATITSSTFDSNDGYGAIYGDDYGVITVTGEGVIFTDSTNFDVRMGQYCSADSSVSFGSDCSPGTGTCSAGTCKLTGTASDITCDVYSCECEYPTATPTLAPSPSPTTTDAPTAHPTPKPTMQPTPAPSSDGEVSAAPRSRAGGVCLAVALLLAANTAFAAAKQ